MKDEKLISLASDGKDIYGLTETGKLAIYDRSVGDFVQRTNGSILTMDKANTLKKPMGEVLELKPRGRTGPIEIVPDKEEKPSLRIAFLAYGVAMIIGVIVLSLLFLWFSK